MITDYDFLSTFDQIGKNKLWVMAFQLNVRKLKAIIGQLFSSASIITDRFPSGKSQSLYPFDME